jgi:hypothetical protein
VIVFGWLPPLSVVKDQECRELDLRGEVSGALFVMSSTRRAATPFTSFFATCVFHGVGLLRAVVFVNLRPVSRGEWSEDTGRFEF